MTTHDKESGTITSPVSIVWEYVHSGEFEFRCDIFKVFPGPRMFKVIENNAATMTFKYELAAAAGAPSEVHTITVRKVSDLSTTITFEADFGKDTPASTIKEWKHQSQQAISYLKKLTAAPRRTNHPFHDRSKHMDSKLWDVCPPRDTDILVLTHIKSGTTWMQQICWQITNGGKENPADYNQLWHSPWVDSPHVPPAPLKQKYLANMVDPRVLKSHLPLDALPWNPKTKYIYVARSGKDVIMSAWQHHTSCSDVFRTLVDIGPRLEFAPFFEGFLAGTIYWDWFTHITSYWKYRHLPNILLVHYNDLKQDLRGNVKKIAKFCGYELDEKQIDDCTKQSSFEWMKKHENLFSPPGLLFAEGNFIYKGTNQRWKDVMTPDQIRRFDEACKKHFEPELLTWLNRD